MRKIFLPLLLLLMACLPSLATDLTVLNTVTVRDSRFVVSLSDYNAVASEIFHNGYTSMPATLWDMTTCPSGPSSVCVKETVLIVGMSISHDLQTHYIHVTRLHAQPIWYGATHVIKLRYTAPTITATPSITPTVTLTPTITHTPIATPTVTVAAYWGAAPSDGYIPYTDASGRLHNTGVSYWSGGISAAIIQLQRLWNGFGQDLICNDDSKTTLGNDYSPIRLKGTSLEVNNVQSTGAPTPVASSGLANKEFVENAVATAVVVAVQTATAQ